MEQNLDYNSMDLSILKKKILTLDDVYDYCLIESKKILI